MLPKLERIFEVMETFGSFVDMAVIEVSDRKRCLIASLDCSPLNITSHHIGDDDLSRVCRLLVPIDLSLCMALLLGHLWPFSCHRVEACIDRLRLASVPFQAASHCGRVRV